MRRLQLLKDYFPFSPAVSLYWSVISLASEHPSHSMQTLDKQKGSYLKRLLSQTTSKREKVNIVLEQFISTSYLKNTPEFRERARHSTLSLFM